MITALALVLSGFSIKSKLGKIPKSVTLESVLFYGIKKKVVFVHCQRSEAFSCKVLFMGNEGQIDSGRVTKKSRDLCGLPEPVPNGAFNFHHMPFYQLI